MTQRMSFDFRLAPAGASGTRRRRDDDALRIVLLGDFSNRADRGVNGDSLLADRQPAPVDVDNFDRLLARLAPKLHLPIGDGDPITVAFTSLEDFHPDAIYRRLAWFDGLRSMRGRLRDRTAFDAAAAELRRDLQAPVALPAEVRGNGATPAAPGGNEADEDTLARLLGRAPATETARHAAQAGLAALIRSIVAPHVTQAAPPHQVQYVEAVDALLGARMRALLHHPQFQALEALWRGLYWLVSNLETNEKLQLYVLDVSRAELLADARQAGAELASSALYRLLVEQGRGTAGSAPWSLLIGNDSFGVAGEDVTLLACLGAIASVAGGPFVAAARPELLGCDSLARHPDPRDWQPPVGDVAAGWNALRDSRMASWIGLVLPRLLLRLPYGAHGERIESFSFDELAGVPAHQHLLWGNGALAAALLIGRAFAASGWAMAPGDELEIGDLPAYVVEADGEKHLQACAEVNLADRASEAMLEAGLMPLLSHRSRNAVRLARFQSIARPLAPLRGPWSG